MVMKMFKINLLLNIIIVIGLFVIDGITSNILGIFNLILIFLLPKMRSILLNKKIYSDISYEILELLINCYLIIIIIRSLFDNSINFNNFEVFTYSYTIIRILIVIIILVLFNLIKQKNKYIKKIYIDDYNFGYIVLFIAIFSSYFAIKYQQNLNTITSIIFCGLNIYFCFKLIIDFNYKQSGLFYSIIISILSIILGNELLILLTIRTFLVTLDKDKIN